VAKAWNFDRNLGGAFVEERDDATRTYVPPAIRAAANVDKLSGGMVALVPSAADRARLVVTDMEPDEDLHLTLWFLSDDAAALSEDFLGAVKAAVEEVAGFSAPVETAAFGVGLWNWAGDSPSIVLNVSDPDRQLSQIRADVSMRAADALLAEWTQVQTEQHYPWVPHVCLAYADDPAVIPEALSRVGTVTFDVLRVSFGADVFDYTLGGTNGTVPEGVVEAAAGEQHRAGHHGDAGHRAQRGR
jgi:2'-5' RNA ligase